MDNRPKLDTIVTTKSGATFMVSTICVYYGYECEYDTVVFPCDPSGKMTQVEILGSHTTKDWDEAKRVHDEFCDGLRNQE